MQLFRHVYLFIFILPIGDTEQGLTVPPILPIVGTGINGPSEVQQPYHPDCSKGWWAQHARKYILKHPVILLKVAP